MFCAATRRALGMRTTAASTAASRLAPPHDASRLLCTDTPKISPGGFFELRTDAIHPGAIAAYLDEHSRTAAERRSLFPGWLGMWKTELGGSVHTVQHLYHWKDYDERDRTRRAADGGFDALRGWMPEPADSAPHAAQMVLPLPSLRQKLQSSNSVVMLEATDALQSCALPGASGFAPRQPAQATDGFVAWELRRAYSGYSNPRLLHRRSSGARSNPHSHRLPARAGLRDGAQVSRAVHRGPARQARG